MTTLLVFKISVLLLIFVGIYVHGHLQTSKADEQKLIELSRTYENKYRFTLAWWGYQLNVQALSADGPNEDDALAIGRLYWIDGDRLRRDCGKHWFMTFFDSTMNPQFRVGIGHERTKQYLLTYRLQRKTFWARLQPQISRKVEIE